MRLPFFKMHGAGNDFVVVLDPEGRFPGDAPPAAGAASALPSNALAARICAPHTGLVCEGLLVLQRATAPEGADFRMVFYNPDGSRASMCGNGARCAALCAYRAGWTARRATFATDAGTVPSEVMPGDGPSGGAVAVGMNDPGPVTICDALDPSESRFPFPDGFNPTGIFLLDTGVPHAVQFTDNLPGMDVAACGRFVRWHSFFAPCGTNVDFVQVLGDREIAIRTFERGVEAETPACGTGVTAAAVAAMALGKCGAPVSVRVAFGATLSVDCDSCDADGARGLRLTGPAAFVCSGQLETDWFATA